MEYKYCCSNVNKVKYNIGDGLVDSDAANKLSYLLWHLPEVDSYQAEHGTVFAMEIYDDILFSELLINLGMNDEDIKIIDGVDVIDDSDISFYLTDICANCQKIIIARKKIGKTKIVALFKNLRDCIAHGCFCIVDDLLVGFNHPKFGGKKYTAFFKIKYNNLFESISSIIDGGAIITIYKSVLHKLDYKILDDSQNNRLIVLKNDICFCLDFKRYKGRYINQTDVQKYLMEIADPTNNKMDCVRILVVDSTYSSFKVFNYLKGKAVGIMDKKFVSELIEGKDVLMEIGKKLDFQTNKL